ncbi:MAG: PAS domain S-box protein [Armatimonadota bacterium]
MLNTPKSYCYSYQAEHPVSRGLHCLKELSWGSHTCCFYQAREDLVNLLAYYFQIGLENNERCVWVLPEGLSREAAIALLGDALPQLHCHLTTGQLVVGTPGDWYYSGGHFSSNHLTERWMASIEEARTLGYAGVRAAGDLSQFNGQDWLQVLEFEFHQAQSLGSNRLILLCTYTKVYNVAQISGILRAHPYALLCTDGQVDVIEDDNSHLTQKALQQEREFATAVIDTVGALIVIMDRDGYIIRFNRRCEEVTGYTFDEVRGRSIWDLLLLPEEVKSIATVYENLLAGLQPNASEHHWLTKFGHRRLITWSNTAIFTEKDEDSYIICTGIDITERQLIERALRESERRFFELANGLPQTVFESDLDGRLTFTNDSSLEMFGYTREDLLRGQTIWMILHPQARQRLRDDIRQLIARNEASMGGEYEALRKDGTSFPIQAYYQLINKYNMPVGMRGIIFDLTERKKAEQALRESEARYRTTVESQLEAVCRWTPDTALTFVNESYCQLLGKTREELLGKKWVNLLPVKERRIAKRQVKAIVAKSRIASYERQIFREGHDGTWIQWIHCPIAGTDTNTTEYQSVGRDVTKLKLLMNDLHRRFRLEQVIATISSDIMSQRDLGEAIHFALTNLGKEIKADRAFLSTALNTDKSLFGESYEWYVKGGMQQTGTFWRCIKNNLPWLTNMLFAGTTVHIPDISRLPKEAKSDQIALLTQEITALLLLPIYVDGEMEGFVGFANTVHSEMWSKDDLALLKTASGIIGSAIERKRANDALETLIKEWRATFDALKSAVALVDLQGTVLRCNKSLITISGKSFNDIIGQRCNQLNLCPHSDAEACPLTRMRETHCTESVICQQGERWYDERIDPLFDAEGRLIGGVQILTDITESKIVEQKILQYQEQLRSLASQLSLAEQRERKHIATELHESLGQSLALMKLQLDTLSAQPISSKVSTALTGIRELLVNMISYTRSLTFELSPTFMGDIGLFATTEWLAESLTTQYNIRIQVTGYRIRLPLTDDTRGLLFSAIRELLVNAIKHARAQEVKVTFSRYQDYYSVTITDDGIGFNLVEIEKTYSINKKFGLFNMKERIASLGGQAEIITQPGSGTEISMLLPDNY